MMRTDILQGATPFNWFVGVCLFFVVLLGNCPMAAIAEVSTNAPEAKSAVPATSVPPKNSKASNESEAAPKTDETSKSFQTAAKAEAGKLPGDSGYEKPPILKSSLNSSNDNQMDSVLSAVAKEEVATNAAESADSPDQAPKPTSELGELPVPSSIRLTNESSGDDRLKQVAIQFDLAREQRLNKEYAAASQVLVGIMNSVVPIEFKRKSLFELALVAQDEGKLIKAQQIFGQYLHLYSKDPSVPEILLRQGLIYRQMGVNTLAVSKFYAVMSSALKLKLENMDYYQKLVLQAQVEIADTFYMEGNYEDACDYYNRLLKSGSEELDREQIHYKLVRSLSFSTNSSDTVARAQSFLTVYTNSTDVPEVRFLLASVLKRVGRNQDAMKQVLLLLEDRQGTARRNQDVWIYWQQRAGNEIASQLFKEGDFLSALQIYQNLAVLDKTPEWQLPVWYQTALVFEQLEQPVKAVEVYSRIIERKKDLNPGSLTPSLESLLEMSQWRKDYLNWLDKARATNLSLQPSLTNSLGTADSATNAPPTAALPQ
jgi:tetratricopeptide (TPR) repeat protein